MIDWLLADYRESEREREEKERNAAETLRHTLHRLATGWLAEFFDAGWTEVEQVPPQFRYELEASTPMVSVLIPFDWSKLAPTIFQFWVSNGQIRSVALLIVRSSKQSERVELFTPAPTAESVRHKCLAHMLGDTDGLAERKRQFDESAERERREAVRRARPSDYGLANLDGKDIDAAMATMREAGATNDELAEMISAWNVAKRKRLEEENLENKKRQAQAAARQDVLDWLDRLRPVIGDALAAFEVYYRSLVPVKVAVATLEYGVTSDGGCMVETVRVLAPEDAAIDGDTFVVRSWPGWEKRIFRHVVSLSAPVLIDGKTEDYAAEVYPLEKGADSCLHFWLLRNRLVDRAQPQAWNSATSAIKALAWPRLSGDFTQKYAPYIGDLSGFVGGIVAQVLAADE